MLTGGLIATALLLLVVFAHIGLIGILPALFVVVASIGMVLSNATALALADHPHTAGSASALVGVAGTRTALPMVLVIAILGVSALLTFFLLGRPRLHQSPP